MNIFASKLAVGGGAQIVFLGRGGGEGERRADIFFSFIYNSRRHKITFFLIALSTVSL